MVLVTLVTTSYHFLWFIVTKKFIGKKKLFFFWGEGGGNIPRFPSPRQNPDAVTKMNLYNITNIIPANIPGYTIIRIFC